MKTSYYKMIGIQLMLVSQLSRFIKKYKKLLKNIKIKE